MALTVFRLKTKANFEVCTTGIVAGISPLRILSTKYGARLQSSGKLTPWVTHRWLVVRIGCQGHDGLAMENSGEAVTGENESAVPLTCDLRKDRFDL